MLLVVSFTLSLAFSKRHVSSFLGIKKRLVTAGKLKSLSALQDWVEPIVKHLYWCAESSDGAPEEILPKWTSLVAHVADVHEHADAIYPRCQHGDLGRKKWLSEGRSTTVHSSSQINNSNMHMKDGHIGRAVALVFNGFISEKF